MRLKSFVCIVTVIPMTRGFPVLLKAVQSNRIKMKMGESKVSADLDGIFSKELSIEIADEVRSVLKLPIPAPIVTAVLSQSIRGVSSNLSATTLREIRELLEASSTTSKYDDVIEVEPLVGKIAKEINPKVHMPLLDDAVEEELLRKIFEIALKQVTRNINNNNEPNYSQSIQRSIGATRDVLKDDSSREMLINSLNQAISIPLIEKSQQRLLISVAVAASADFLQSLLPPDLIEALRGESSESIAKIKEYLIDSVVQKVNIAGLDNEQERLLLEKMVDILIDAYANDTEAELLLLSFKEQEEYYYQKCLLLDRELDLARRRYLREQKAINAQIDRLEEKMKDARRGQGFFTRIFRRRKRIKRRRIR